MVNVRWGGGGIGDLSSCLDIHTLHTYLCLFWSTFRRFLLAGRGLQEDDARQVAGDQAKVS